jgi:hypothetical protein
MPSNKRYACCIRRGESTTAQPAVTTTVTTKPKKQQSRFPQHPSPLNLPPVPFYFKAIKELLDPDDFSMVYDSMSSPMLDLRRLALKMDTRDAGSGSGM